MKKSLLFALLTLMLPIVANAYNFSVDGIYYNKNSDGTSVTVTYKTTSDRGYSGSVAIPSQVTYSGKTYSVTSIGEGSFYGCRSLTSVTIPNSVTSIGYEAFRDCSDLASVTIPNSVTSIDIYAFYGCSGLTSVTIDNGVTSIGMYAFSGCSSLTSITIPNSVTSIGSSAFYNCSDLTSVMVEDGNPKYDSRNNCNAIIESATNTLIAGCKTTTIPNGVTSIGNYAFDGCSGLTSVTIPNSVTSIGKEAFFGCSGLTSVTIPNSVTSIGDRAFSYCSGLTSVTIPNNVTSIGNSAFSGCSGLTSIDIPNSVTSIGNQAFYKCSTLTSITIPSSVTSIGSSAFSSCSGLTSVTIPNSVTIIGGYAFSGCSGLTSVTIPNSVTSIGEGAFSGCSGLTSLKVEEGNPKYDSRNNCNAIIESSTNTLIAGCKNTIIPNSVTSIGSNAFYACSGLTSVTIPNSVTSIGKEAFFGCSGLTSVTLNANDIVSKTYSSSSNLGTIFGSQVKEYVLGDDVKGIGNYAFYKCSGLTSVTIPNSVTSIGGYAFSGCPLQTIVNRGDNDIDKSTFSDRVYLHTQLYVPEGTVWDYIFNTGWGEFHNIREFANNADNIRNNAVYLIADHSGRNFPVYDRATKSLKNVVYTLNLDDNDAGACWRIVKDGSDTYLYNIGAGMYAAYDVENKLSLSTVPSAVDIKVTKEGTTINGRPAMLVVNKSVTPDPTYIIGDANGNGVVEIGDVTSVLTLMATPDATGYNNKAADANGNGEIEIGDVTTILTIMAGN